MAFVGQLGLQPPKYAPSLKLGEILSGVVPAHPGATDHLSLVTDWQMLGNNQYGVCGPVSEANLRAIVTRYLTGRETYPGWTAVRDLYRLVNPDFSEATGAGDNGVIMQTMLEMTAKYGFDGVKPVAFAQVRVDNPDEVDAAISIFGGLLAGATLRQVQQSQTHDYLWDYVPNSPAWGGHAVLVGQYYDKRRKNVTWAQLVDMTERFWEEQVEEAWVMIWPEHLVNPAFQEGIDLNALAAGYAALTDRPLPLPGPVTDLDCELWDKLWGFLNKRHARDIERAASNIREWGRKKGFRL